ncbi:hypothetical protein HPP92_025293 [Vanilla planifolia]|uniref:non-specific serine/threonine protein kinase n=1 Tax=Vanilla planifolia TaxID=51239 RepID=A0A835PGD2_VANPL|nr:hypothetical protein HPP92_025293 [Vanilla planifolia]
MILAVALSSAVGALALIVILFLFLRYCILDNTGVLQECLRLVHLRHLCKRWTLPIRIARRTAFWLEELNLATRNFNDINLIGRGSFGEAYKGLLQDGTIVAIKRRLATPSQVFVEEIRYLSSIRHRNLVTLLGYCQDVDMQMIIYDYIPNGSVSSHIYGTSQVSANTLEFKHRLSIAHGAAKGLDHLHSLSSPLVHMNFKTANVLVDEDFIAKVADAGLRILLYRVDGAAASQMTLDDPFLDPEVKEFGRFSVKSDVYSFGVFLIELVSGCEMKSEKSIRKWVQSCEDLNDTSALVDQRMSKSFTSEGMIDLLHLILRCLASPGERRPPMNHVVSEVERIRDKEMSLTTIMGEGTTTVTLGSQLFK